MSNYGTAIDKKWQQKWEKSELYKFREQLFKWKDNFLHKF